MSGWWDRCRKWTLYWWFRACKGAQGRFLNSRNGKWYISLIKLIKFFVNDNSGKNNEQDLASTFGRRFQIGQNDEFSSDNNDDIMRTKRRTQRLTLLMAKVQSTRSGERLRPREFLRQINNYGTFQKDYRFIFGFVGSRKNGLKLKKNGRLISD